MPRHAAIGQDITSWWTESDDKVPELTKATRHVSLADRPPRDTSPGDNPRNRRSKDDVSAGDESDTGGVLTISLIF